MHTKFRIDQDHLLDFWPSTGYGGLMTLVEIRDSMNHIIEVGMLNMNEHADRKFLALCCQNFWWPDGLSVTTKALPSVLEEENGNNHVPFHNGPPLRLH